ncbi:MAG: rod shape-determining protein MreC [Bacteroidota bacterium]
MQNLIRFLIKNHFFIFFIFIEAFAIFLLINNNNYQQTKFVDFTRSVSGSFYQEVEKLNEYLTLKEKNIRLKEENAKLRNYIQKNLEVDIDSFKTKIDSNYNQQYESISAKIINNSVNKQHNYITLNRGELDEVKPGMGVITSDGIIGVIRGVSDHFSTAISLLNKEIKISSKMKESEFFGPLGWNGQDYKFAYLREIPLHADVAKNDTIVTSGYSSIFPEGIPIGYVEAFEEKGGRFYEIKVRLSVDFKQISEVYIIRNLRKQEQKELENQVKYDD